MAIKLRNRLFNDAIGDEVALDGEIEALLPTLRQPASHNDWSGLTRRHGIERATRLLYRGMLGGTDGAFKDLIDGMPVGSIGPSQVQVVVVPGMYYREHPDVGSDGQIVHKVAAALGVRVSGVPLRSTGSIDENVAHLKTHLEHAVGDDPVWLVSISKGGSEVRRYLQAYSLPGKVQGWLNIAGIPGGTPYVDMKLVSPLQRLFYRVMCPLVGVSFKAMDQLRAQHPAWQASHWPTNVEMIHVVPVPLPAHVNPFLSRRYRKLLPFGPNDGLVPLANYLAMPGRMYPLWGVDHFMRTAELSRLLYRFMHYITQPTHRQSTERIS